MASFEAVSHREELTPEFAKKLLIDSFRLSQGNSYVQRVLLGMASERNLQWRIQEFSQDYLDIQKYLCSKKLLKTLHIFRTNASHPGELDTADVARVGGPEKATEYIWKNDGVDVFLQFITGQRQLTQSEREEFIPSLIERDRRFFHLDPGNHPSIPVRKNSFLADFVFSDTLRRGLLTGVFKEICKEIAVQFRAQHLSGHELAQLEQIQNRHNSHPGNIGVNIMDQLRRS